MTTPVSRRQVLRLAVVSAAGVPLLAHCSAAGPQSFGDVAAGNAADLAVGDIKAVPGAPAFVARDAGGVYAMTTTCTHQGCDMTNGVQGSTIFCACHGSKFDADGNVLRGPASMPLAHFLLTVDTAGVMTVHGAQEVDPSTRVAI
jgi:Rieske Fe-S protein